MVGPREMTHVESSTAPLQVAPSVPLRMLYARLSRSAFTGSPLPTRHLLTRRVASRCVAAVAEMVSIDDLKQCHKELIPLIQSKNCNPILVRLAWHDSGTYNKVQTPYHEVQATMALQDMADRWPVCGGANGSIRFKPEIDHGANAGALSISPPPLSSDVVGMKVWRMPWRW